MKRQTKGTFSNFEELTTTLPIETIEDNKIYRWHKAGYPPIDLNENVSSVAKYIQQSEALRQSHKELIEALEETLGIMKWLGENLTDAGKDNVMKEYNILTKAKTIQGETQKKP